MAEKGTMSVREAGRRGGTETRRRHGPGFYTSIGHKGGLTTSRRYGPEFYEKIGHKGGQTVKRLIEQAKRMQKK